MEVKLPHSFSLLTASFTSQPPYIQPEDTSAPKSPHNPRSLGNPRDGEDQMTRKMSHLAWSIESGTAYDSNPT